MKLSFRWYGSSDPIRLEYISQIPGMRSIVTAVYNVKLGEVWPEESLANLKAQCDAHGLVFDVVESIPVIYRKRWCALISIAMEWTFCPVPAATSDYRYI